MMKPQFFRSTDGKSITIHGINLRFLTRGIDTDGKWILIDCKAPPKYSGPPPHVHKKAEEGFYVTSGTLSVMSNGTQRNVSEGEYLLIPPGVVHKFSNPYEEPASFLLFSSPAGLDDYFMELEQLIEEEPSWPPSDMRKVLALMAKYDTYPPSR